MDHKLHHEPREARGFLKHYMKDLVYGANDGIITTFAVVTAVTGAALHPRIVLILGVANLLADGFSMGASNFLSIRSVESIRRADGLGLAEPFPLRHGAVTFATFVVAGAIPLLTYVIDLGDASFRVAVVLTLVALFVVGALRATVSDGGWLKNGVEMLTVGVLAATVSYGVGAIVAPWAG
jgi:VIT1/CCC1 family predicted Fe2+/Mn2+ transporter